MIGRLAMPLLSSWHSKARVDGCSGGACALVVSESGAMRLDQLLGACLQANPQFGFDLRHEIIDDLLQDQHVGLHRGDDPRLLG